MVKGCRWEWMSRKIKWIMKIKRIMKVLEDEGVDTSVSVQERSQAIFAVPVSVDWRYLVGA